MSALFNGMVTVVNESGPHFMDRARSSRFTQMKNDKPGCKSARVLLIDLYNV